MRAAASMLTARLLENICPNFALRSVVPSSPRISVEHADQRAARRAPARISSAVWKPTSVSSRPPRKKPTPLSAFFEPVRIATQR